MTSERDAEWLRDTAMNVMLATEVEEAQRILSHALSLRSAREAEPDFWAVWSSTGSHIGTWADEADARAALTEYESRIPRMNGLIKPLYLHPSPSTKGLGVSDKVPDWMKAEADKVAGNWNHPLHHDHQVLSQDVASALLSACRRSQEEQWRPIGTAPHDEAVLVCGGDVKYPCSASWSGVPDEEWTLDAQGECFDGIGWPTHWMPLPPEPAIRRLGEAE